MVDVVDKETRSRMMSGIRAKHTKPEIQVRRALHAAGLRFRLFGQLPGKPDIVLARFRVAIFVNGCFWHGHGCHLFKMPSTRTEFWKTKLAANVSRDNAVYSDIIREGWRLAIVWECAIKSKDDKSVRNMLEPLVEWIRNNQAEKPIRFEVNDSKREIATVL